MISPGLPLTPREADVVTLVSEGLTNKEIACALGIAEHTVEHHVTHILQKIGATTRTQAAIAWMRRPGGEEA